MRQQKLRLLTRLKRTRVYDPYVNKTLPKRLDWEQIENRPRREGKKVVKGTTKRVIVVKSPNPAVFEQAIFIVKEGYVPNDGDDVLKQAERVADEYIRGALDGTRKLMNKITPALFAAGGAALTGIAWFFLT